MNNKGFTLIEFIIYISISVVLIASLILVTTNLLQARIVINSMEEISRSSRFIVENISYAIRSAESASVNVAGHLLLNIPFPQSQEETIIRELNNNFMIKKGARDSFFEANTKNTEVENLTFNVENDCVRVTFDIRYSTTRAYNKTIRYQFTECIRR